MGLFKKLQMQPFGLGIVVLFVAEGPRGIADWNDQLFSECGVD